VLRSSSQPLFRDYDLAMLDLDGVVYVGGEAVPGAPDHLAEVRRRGLHVAFITNNASRPPATVAAHLEELGVEASAEDVVTSSQAAARLLADRWGKDAVVACLGADGLVEALEAVGLRPVAVDDEAADTAAAIVTGYAPDVRWSQVMRAAVRIRDGLPWVASNTDLTFPAAYGVAPGHGVQVEMLRRFSGVEPVVAGKPARPLLDETVRRVGGSRPLMVGDRLDTDIEGAHNAEVDSLLVLTGVTGLDDLVAATPELRPTYLAADLGGLFEQHRAPERSRAEDGSTRWTSGRWAATVRDGRLEVTESSADGADAASGRTASDDDWWRAVAAAAWDHLDTAGEPADASGLAAPAR
jgi:HAD superfamily hydrolase (TIGR01450 family)